MESYKYCNLQCYHNDGQAAQSSLVKIVPKAPESTMFAFCRIITLTQSTNQKTARDLKSLDSFATSNNTNDRDLVVRANPEAPKDY